MSERSRHGRLLSSSSSSELCVLAPRRSNKHTHTQARLLAVIVACSINLPFAQTMAHTAHSTLAVPRHRRPRVVATVVRRCMLFQASRVREMPACGFCQPGALSSLRTCFGKVRANATATTAAAATTMMIMRDDNDDVKCMHMCVALLSCTRARSYSAAQTYTTPYNSFSQAGRPSLG